MSKLPLFVGLVSLVTLSACRSDILREEHAMKPELRQAARVELLDRQDCQGKENVVSAPEHCVWPERVARSQILAATVQVVAHVGAEGRASSPRVLAGPDEFQAAAADCAMRVVYKPEPEKEGDACLTMRFERYASDLDRYPRDLDPTLPDALCPSRLWSTPVPNCP